MRTRTAVPDDEPSLARIAHAAWSWKSAANPRPSPEPPFFTQVVVPDNVLVAVDEQRVLGYLKLVPLARAQPAIASAAAHVQEIHGFSVSPEHQGRGVGSALLRAAVREATTRSARRITLRVLGTNTGAQELYRRHGYRVEGVLRGEFLLQDRYVDDVLMALDLTAQDPDES